jgi:hypothetical protein
MKGHSDINNYAEKLSPWIFVLQFTKLKTEAKVSPSMEMKYFTIIIYSMAN